MLTSMVARSSDADQKPIVVVVLAKEADQTNPTVKIAMQKGWFVEVSWLSEENCLAYTAIYLNVAQDKVPLPLRQFIAKVSLGNPLYIRETIDQLKDHDQLSIVTGADGEAELQYERDLEAINIAGWSQTAMVGETVCLLESLEPLQAAVLKMSTVFTGTFTLADLASSSCSRWAGATYFDTLRLYRAVQDLVGRGIIEVAGNRSASDNAALSSAKTQQLFAMKNVLVRKVGSAMLLEAQKKVVKRQALIDRALARDLPARMEEVYLKRLEPHIPWYYESVLAKS